MRGRALTLVLGFALGWSLGCDASPVEPPRASPSPQQRPPPIALQPPDDHAIERRLLGIYAELEGLQDVAVRVQDGVVRLGGETDGVATRQRAEAIASRIEGVALVRNDLRPRAGARGWFAPAWRTLRGVGRAALHLLPELGAALLVFAPFLALSLGLRRWRTPLRLLGARQLTGGLVRFTLRVALVVVGLLLVLDILGIMKIVGAIVGALGLVGLAVGLAFKDWVANYVPGVMLGLHPPFKAGDLVRVGSQEGRVIRITPRATVLMTTDGEEVRIPNSSLYRETLINFSHHRARRLRVVIPLSPRVDLRVAGQLGRRALQALHAVLADPAPFMRTRAIERDLVEVEYLAWVDQETVNFRTAESHARAAVFEALARGGVALPEESLTVHVARPRSLAADTADTADAEGASAEERDQAFLAQQLDRALHASEERDLLHEAMHGRATRRSEPSQ